MEARENKQDLSYLSFVQLLSALAVVTLHTNGCFWEFSPEPYWRSANLIECLCYFAVPVFFMVSGITLIDYPARYSTGTFFKKRAVKTLIPFLAWSLIALGAKVAEGSIRLGELSVLSVLNGILSTEYMEIYWFFLALFGVYLCMPLFAAVPREKRRTLFPYLAVGGFVINALIPFLISLFSLPLRWPLSLQAAGGYLLFVIGGVWLHENPPDLGRRLLFYALGLFGLFLHAVGTRHASMAAGQIVQVFKGYTNVPAILYAFAAFLLLRELGKRVMATKAAGAVKALATYSFPVYLMHIFVLSVFKRLLPLNEYSLLYRLGMPWLVFTLIVLITWVMRKIPLVRRLVP